MEENTENPAQNGGYVGSRSREDHVSSGVLTHVELNRLSVDLRISLLLNRKLNRRRIANSEDLNTPDTA
jgi:hypothetical protein